MIEGPLDPLAALGGSRYGGEPLSQLDHALQSAALAEAEGSAPELIVAALLHDIGHLVHPGAEEASRAGVDLGHERIGARLLARWFGPAVTEPVRLHVEAKRYLSQEPSYLSRLSEESKRSLRLQGGPMERAQALLFAELPYADAAVRLRGWDDAAKIPGLAVPGLAHFAPLVTELIRRGR